jgi:subtilisin family serine protease
MRMPRAGVALALVLTGTPAVAEAATPQAPARAAAKLPSGHSWQVTLVTGDVVRVTTVTNRAPLVSIRPGPNRRSVAFHKDVLPDGTVRVVPQDVAAQVGSVYDPALFDVTTLIREGDDDAKRSDLPLIVQGGTRSLAAGGRTLASLGATVVHRPKGAALAGGFHHVWLDRRIRAQALDHNLDQIGAPAAWSAGATGKGVKVAVLDTGVDATHPDLKGRIVEQQNFSSSPDTVDRFGHGTHVAATIAGTGAAANGARRGVAPDADLLIGKVLGDDGYGTESDIIAGMEWAAPRARIVSMSLGGESSDPLNDPLTKSVDQLTATFNTLFVLAAGNSGPGKNTVEVPGVAASALTVGAVDGQDNIADFSSRGGTLLKPEIAAPGVDIIAARAKGTTMGDPIDANYTSASGTSMATPHVSGAAADLLQKHPGWTAARLKAALVSTADATPNTVYAVGAGRLDIGTATTATIVGDQATAAFGSVPTGASGALTRRLSWTNFGTTAVKLHLFAKLTDAAGHDVSAAVSLIPTVTVPAGGSAGAVLSLNPRRLTAAGLYSGVVTAQATGVSLRTPVALYR